MKLLILVIMITCARADNYCRGIYIKDNYYDVEILKQGVNRIRQIAYSNNDNTLYFTFEQIAKTPTTALGYFNLNTRETGLIDGVRNASGLTVDVSKNRIYVGGADGLYFINDVKKSPEKLPVNDDIKYLFFKNVVYYINNRKEAFTFENGLIGIVNELQGVQVDKLIADDDDNLFFLKNKDLFRVKLGTRAVNSHEKYVVDTISTDKNFKPYICAKDGLYVYNKYKYALDKLADNITGLRALTFTGNGDPIYVVIDNIVKLKYNPVACFGD